MQTGETRCCRIKFLLACAKTAWIYLVLLWLHCKFKLCWYFRKLGCFVGSFHRCNICRVILFFLTDWLWDQFLLFIRRNCLSTGIWVSFYLCRTWRENRIGEPKGLHLLCTCLKYKGVFPHSPLRYSFPSALFIKALNSSVYCNWSTPSGVDNVYLHVFWRKRAILILTWLTLFSLKTFNFTSLEFHFLTQYRRYVIAYNSCGYVLIEVEKLKLLLHIL